MAQLLKARWARQHAQAQAFFCYCEDVDLAFRVRLQGGTGVQAPDAIGHHVGSASKGPESHFTLYHSARNRVWLMGKNLPLVLLVPLLPGHLAYMALTLWRHPRDSSHYFSASSRACVRPFPASALS
jgi:GT2 family glycosyltransferase